MRPLDTLGSIKRKLGTLIVAAVLVTIAVLEVGRIAGWPPLPVAIAAALIALAMVQVLAHGMTFPLREMARAAPRLAAGEPHEPITATSRDEVGALARAFNQMAEQIAQTDRLRRELVATVSHELRTPIAALRAVLENLADGVEQPDAATLDRLLRQTERLQALVESLLDLSRLEAGVAHLDLAEVEVRILIADALELVAGTPDVPVRVVVDPPGLTVCGDERRLVQVLVNLVANARAHAPEGSDIEVAACRHAGAVELAVTDRGPGVAAADAERIFERFHRGEQLADGGVRADPRDGSGLGLAITRWILELHGGAVRVDLDHRPGCRMVVTLPRTPPPSGAPPTAADGPEQRP